MPAFPTGRHSRARRVALAVLVAGLGCDGTGPDATLSGVWTARHAVFGDYDSLVIAAWQDGSEIKGYGMLRMTGQPIGQVATFTMQGSRAGRSAEMQLTSMATNWNAPLFIYVLRGAVLSPSLIAGTLEPLPGEPTITLGEREIALRRSRPPVADAVGTWVHYTILETTPGYTLSIHDTVVVFPDGRAWRRRTEPSSMFGTVAVWSRRGDWLVLENFHGAYFDSLRVEPDALLRVIPRWDGPPLVERFERVSMTARGPW